MSDYALVPNAGSSSLKFSVYKRPDDQDWRLSSRGQLKSVEPRSRLAVDYFVYQAAMEIGALAAVLGGIEGLVLTAGIGENSAEIRRRIIRASAWLGIELDEDANARAGPRISTHDSRVSAWVIPANEELMIARHTGPLLGLAVERR